MLKKEANNLISKITGGSKITNLNNEQLH